MAKMVLSVQEGVGNGAQLVLKNRCPLLLHLYLLLIY